MNNLPRQKLIEIINRNGHALIHDPRRCAGLMRDYFPAYRREIAVLSAVLEERIPAQLLSVGNSAIPRPVLLARLAQRLHQDMAIEESAAHWAINTWALALGVISPADLSALEESRSQQTTAPSSTKHAADLKAQNPAPPPSTPNPAATPSSSHTAVTAPASAPHKTTQGSTTLVVAIDGSGDFLTLGDALRRAPNTTRLFVRPGNYLEGFVIDKPIEIIGDGALEEIIIRATLSSCIVMNTDTATVRNLTLRGQARRGGANNAGFFAVDIPRGRLLLEDCDISSDSLSCIAIHNPNSEPTIRRCRIHHGVDSGIYAFNGGRGNIVACDVFENSNVGVALTGGARTNIIGSHIHHGRDAGIVVWDKATSTIEDCDVYENASAGIGISDNGTTTVRRCRIHDGNNTGILAHESGQATLEECNIYSHKEAEVAATTGGNIHLGSCQIHHGFTSGIIVRNAGRALLESCDVFNNRDSGVHVDAGGICVARNCRINENGHVGVSCEGGGAVNIESCDLTGNRVAAWQTDHGAHVESRNNRL